MCRVNGTSSRIHIYLCLLVINDLTHHHKRIFESWEIYMSFQRFFREKESRLEHHNDKAKKSLLSLPSKRLVIQTGFSS